MSDYEYTDEQAALLHKALRPHLDQVFPHLDQVSRGRLISGRMILKKLSEASIKVEFPEPRFYVETYSPRERRCAHWVRDREKNGKGVAVFYDDHDGVLPDAEDRAEALAAELERKGT